MLKIYKVVNSPKIMLEELEIIKQLINYFSDTDMGKLSHAVNLDLIEQLDGFV